MQKNKYDYTKNMLMTFESSQTGRSNFSPFVRSSVGVSAGGIYELERNAKILED